jgi:hypothetical protein
MKLITLFDKANPPRLVYSEQIPDPNGINFVSSSGENEGIIRRVQYNQKNKLYSKGSITVPLKGSVLSAFVQPADFYIAYEIAVLTPKKSMTLSEKIFYCLCIRHNSFRYNYGRQANRTLEDLELPDKIPDFVNEKDFKKISEDLTNHILKFLDKT